MKRTLLFFAGLSAGFIASTLIYSQAGQQLVATGQVSQGSARRDINPPGNNAQVPISDGVLVGNTLYLSGKLGTDPKTNKIPDDLEQEIRLMFDRFKATLAEAGMTMDHVVSVTVYCPDLTLYDKFNSIYRTYFTKNFPARAFIGSGPLLRGGHFEMQGIAVK
ncbi:MAG TPA: RidA family protein [Blastocatellia bacterium]|nr:RidA family protein [Blastocatellia bacterium]